MTDSQIVEKYSYIIGTGIVVMSVFPHINEQVVREAKQRIEQMRFEDSVEPDSTFNNHHLHFYLEYPTSTTQLISDTLLSFIGANRWEEKKEWYEPSKSLETILEARYQNHRPHYGMIEIVRNIWDEKGWINYISKKELNGYKKEVIWK